MGFQKDFMWGGSVSSMQTEGAYNEDGKGMSIYDVLPAKPDHSDWKTAIDSYHHYKEDNALFAGMHFNAYRFSVSWVRVLPDGEGEVNQKGLAFYDSFVNDLIEKGMEPVICLYHFDIPMKLLEKYGGWCSRKMVEAYENYARLIMEHFKGRVRYYIPFNEQNVASLVQMEAVEEYGVDLMGFLTWGPIDLLSSSGEMRKRYGFIYVNRTDQEIRDLKRSKKKSYYWFAKVIESNGEEL